MRKRRIPKNLDDLINELESAIDYLCYSFRIPGYTKEDLKQELRLMIVKHYKRNKDKGLDWWFIRCKWRLLEIVKKSITNPLTYYISLDPLLLDNFEIDEYECN